MEKKKVPEIRFEGFTDDWEQYKMGDIVDVCSGRDYKHLSEGDIPVYGTGGYMLSVNKALSYDRDAVGIGRKGTIDKPYILRAPFWTVDTLFYVLPRDYENIDFTFDIFQTIDWRKKDESTGVPSLSKEAINEIKIMIPSSEEQKKIGEYFKQLDNLIIFQQCKYEKLKLFKEAMLEKMFPKNGEKIPEIRFKGFSDDWEQCKLGEFGKATSGTSIESEFSEDGIYKVISIGSYSENNIYIDQKIRAKDSEKTRKRMLNKGDLTMILNDKTVSGNIIGKVLLIEKSGVYVYNQRTERMEIDSEKYDSLFIYQMLNAPQIRDKIIKQSQGNTQIYVNWSNISLTEYMVPKINEQCKLGKYFQGIDHLITLHQYKYEKLKLFKQTMLQKTLL